MYTLTSIGYGDVSAQNLGEYIVATFLMASSSIIWAFTIGNFCSIVSTMDKHTIIFRQTMDELNFMMKDRGLPIEMRERVRLYFHQSKDTQRVLCYHDLEQQMSTQLRGEVANHENSGWVMSIGFFTQVPVEEQTNLITEIAVMLRSCVYCPSDTVVHEGSPNNVMYIVQRGIAELIIGKHRNGPTGVVKLKWWGAWTRFDNLSQREENPF